MPVTLTNPVQLRTVRTDAATDRPSPPADTIGRVGIRPIDAADLGVRRVGDPAGRPTSTIAALRSGAALETDAGAREAPRTVKALRVETDSNHEWGDRVFLELPKAALEDVLAIRIGPPHCPEGTRLEWSHTEGERIVLKGDVKHHAAWARGLPKLIVDRVGGQTETWSLSADNVDYDRHATSEDAIAIRHATNALSRARTELADLEDRIGDPSDAGARLGVLKGQITEVGDQIGVRIGKLADAYAGVPDEDKARLDYHFADRHLSSASSAHSARLVKLASRRLELANQLRRFDGELERTTLPYERDKLQSRIALSSAELARKTALFEKELWPNERRWRYSEMEDDLIGDAWPSLTDLMEHEGVVRSEAAPLEKYEATKARIAELEADLRGLDE